jgi:hypothetical protein
VADKSNEQGELRNWGHSKSKKKKRKEKRERERLFMPWAWYLAHFP